MHIWVFRSLMLNSPEHSNTDQNSVFECSATCRHHAKPTATNRHPPPEYRARWWSKPARLVLIRRETSDETTDQCDRSGRAPSISSGFHTRSTQLKLTYPAVSCYKDTKLGNERTGRRKCDARGDMEQTLGGCITLDT